VLKLGESKEILDAWLGTRKLSHSEVVEMYGTDPPSFKTLEWPDKMRDLEEDKGAYWVMLGYTDCCKVPIICLVT
jgi:hypothetical protein